MKQRTGIGYSRHDDHPVAPANPSLGSVGEQRQRLALLHSREIERLVRIESQRVAHDAHVERVEVLGTLGDQHEIGPVDLSSRVAQPAPRQQPVAVNRTIVVHQQDIDPRLDIPVLKSVVENNQFDLGVNFPQPADSLGPFFANRHRNVGILHLHLLGFVAYALDRRARSREHEPFGPAAIPARKYGYSPLARKTLDQKFGHRRLARTADSQIAHAHDRNVELLAPENLQIEQLVPDVDYQTVYPGQRGRYQSG